MKIKSVNIGLIRTLNWKGKAVETAIYKHPVEGPVRVLEQQLEGDRQADLRFHGGPHKSVYAYPHEHYSYWEERLQRRDLTPGMFGENLTTEGLLEDKVRIGDVFRVGSALLMATQPRIPCFKLGLRFGDPTLPKQFLEAARNGIYFKVIQTGSLRPGDAIALHQPSAYPVSIAATARAFARPEAHRPIVRSLLEIPHLPPPLRKHFAKAAV